MKQLVALFQNKTFRPFSCIKLLLLGGACCLVLSLNGCISMPPAATSVQELSTIEVGYVRKAVSLESVSYEQAVANISERMQKCFNVDVTTHSKGLITYNAYRVHVLQTVTQSQFNISQQFDYSNALRDKGKETPKLFTISATLNKDSRHMQLKFYEKYLDKTPELIGTWAQGKNLQLCPTL